MGERVDLNRLKSPTTLLALGIGGVILLVIGLVIEVRIIVENPAYGDVTDVVRGIWNLSIALATLGSFVLAVYNYRRDDDTDGPPTQFSVRGENHDIDFHLHMGESNASSESVHQHDDDTADEGPEGESEPVSDDSDEISDG